MVITICKLVLHDYLYYASREMGRLYETEKYLHNYGLMYALGLARSPYASVAQVPHYADDLEPANEQGIYVTPAYPVHYTFAFHTFKMANVDYYNLTPQISSNQVVFGRAKELAPESAFQFFVLSGQAIRLPRWIRLGKWMAKAQISIMAQGTAQERQGPYHASGALNPLDLIIVPENCNIVAMAPASLITNVSATSSYYEFRSPETDELARLPAGMKYRTA